MAAIQPTLFDGARMGIREAIDLTAASLQAHGSAYGMVLFVLCIGFIIWYVINNFRENES